MLLGTKEEQYKGYTILSLKRTNRYIYQIKIGEKLVYSDDYPYDDEVMVITTHNECFKCAKKYIDTRLN